MAGVTPHQVRPQHSRWMLLEAPAADARLVAPSASPLAVIDTGTESAKLSASRTALRDAAVVRPLLLVACEAASKAADGQSQSRAAAELADWSAVLTASSRLVSAAAMAGAAIDADGRRRIAGGALRIVVSRCGAVERVGVFQALGYRNGVTVQRRIIQTQSSLTAH